MSIFTVRLPVALISATLMGGACLLAPVPGPAQTVPPPQPPPATVTPNLPETKSEIAALLKQAKSAIDDGKWEDALKVLNQAWERARSLGDKAGEGKTTAAIGAIYSALNQPQKAVEYYLQAVPIFRQTGNKRGEANTLYNCGNAYSKNGQMDKAQECFQRTLPIYRQIGDKPGEARTLTNLGTVYETLGKSQKAMECYLQALPIHRQAGERTNEALTLNRIAMAYYLQGQTQKALQFAKQALLIYRQIGDKMGEAGVLDYTGSIWRETGQPRKALEFAREALSLFRQVGSKRGEGAALTNVGLVYADTGQPQKALEFFHQALSLHRQEGNRKFEADTLTDIGTIYYSINQPQKALEFQQQALLIRRQIGDRAGEANALINIGQVYSTIRQPQRALEFSLQALPISRRIGDEHGEADALGQIGILYGDLRQFQKSENFLKRALPVYRRIGDKRNEAGILISLSHLSKEGKQPQNALTILRQALLICRQIDTKDTEAIVLRDMGTVYTMIGDRSHALACFRKSIERTEQVRSVLTNDTDARTAFFESNLTPYYHAIHMLSREGSRSANQEAFGLTQKVKARSLLDRLGNARADLNGRLTADEKDKENDLYAECDRLNRAMIAEGIKNEVGSRKRYEGYKNDLQMAEQALSIYRDRLFARHPDLAARRIARTASLQEAVRSLGEETALLEFIHLKEKSLDRLVLFVLSWKHGKPVLVVRDLHTATDLLTERISDLRNACLRPNRPYKEKAEALYRLLIDPVEPALVGKKHLLICPDSLLWNLPFAILEDRQGQQLWERFSLTFAFSATGARAAGTLSRSLQRQTVNLPGALVIADPDFRDAEQPAGSLTAGDTVRPLNYSDRPITIPDRPITIPDRGLALTLPNQRDRANALRSLPGTRKEAEAIRAAFPNTTVLMGADAQEAAVKKQIPEARFLHLGTHGFFNDASPLLSSLVLATPPPTGEGSEEDGLLTAREFLEMDLSRCELAVLSACNTGVGEQRSGEGIVGLTWCLTAAGCPSQIVSAWPVNDASTAKLMGEFYNNLKQGKDKAEALRAAALAVRREPATAHPYYWAPFFLVGEAH